MLQGIEPRQKQTKFTKPWGPPFSRALHLSFALPPKQVIKLCVRWSSTLAGCHSFCRSSVNWRWLCGWSASVGRGILSWLANIYQACECARVTYGREGCTCVGNVSDSSSTAILCTWNTERSFWGDVSSSNPQTILAFVRGSAKRQAPGCMNAEVKARQKQ